MNLYLTTLTENKLKKKILSVYNNGSKRVKIIQCIKNTKINIW